MTVSTRRLLPLAVATTAVALLLPPAARLAAQTTSPIIARPFDIGAKKSQKKPYSFTGRILDLDLGSQGSGALIRRHTVLTAAHVVYDPTTGFGSALTFERALYVDRRTNTNLRLSTQRASAVGVLSGYQDIAATGVNSATEARDLGYMVIAASPVDEDFAPYARQPEPTFKDNALTDPSIGRFITGYPIGTFGGSIMTYTVPTQPFVEVSPGNYNNLGLLAEGGNSGGPVFAVINGVQTIVGELTYGYDGVFEDGALAITGIRAIDKEADRFLVAAEYVNGLVAGATITPTDTTNYPVNQITNQITVNRGAVVTFNTRVVFTTPARGGGTASTDRYSELTLTSDYATNVTSGSNPTPLVAIMKLGSNQFQVTFNAALRTGTVVTLQTQYNKNTNVPSAPVPTNTAPGVTPVSPAPSTLRVVVR